MPSAIQAGTRLRSDHDPRAAALRVINGVLVSAETSQALLDRHLRESRLVPSDKRLCTELVYGYLRRSRLLDWSLLHFLKKPDKLPLEMLLVLGLAAYESAYLRTPAYACVNWAVSRIRNRFGARLASVANGVLRSFSSKYNDLSDSAHFASIADYAERIALMYSLPTWIVRLWLGAYGEETALAFMRASMLKPLPALRVNAARAEAASVRGRLLQDERGTPVSSYGVAFPEGLPFCARSLVKEGYVSLQSPAVQEILAALDLPSWNTPLWDACAGRGGKTAAMLERGLAVSAATDISAKRIADLSSEIKRLHLQAPEFISVCDAASPPSDSLFRNSFETIVADVPCSGLGTLARRPEIRFRRSEADILTLAALQDRILDAAVTVLRRGGQIIYLTCTLNPLENEKRVHAFLSRHTGFSLRREFMTPADAPWQEFMYGAVLAQTH